MEIIKKSESITHKNNQDCTVHEYPQSEVEINGGIIELDGRYPEEGWARNMACTSLIHVIEGKGKALQGNTEIILEQDDQLMIVEREPYAFEGDMKFLFVASPAWTPEQARVAKHLE